MFLVSDSQRAPRVHFSGIGGTGMVAGARLAIEAGWEVRGSDTPLYPPTSEMVRDLGVPVQEGYRAENLEWQPDVVVIGNALSRGNPEVEAILERRLNYTSLPEWLKDVVLRIRRPIVIAGTHGKTTTTALAAYLLDKRAENPGYFIGGQSRDFAYSARLGREGGPFVIEGDEYDTAFFDKRAKFFHYLPEVAVVTSLEYDHADIYKSVEEIETAFRLMLRQMPASGHLLLCADSDRALALRDYAYCPVQTYGFDPGADWRIVETAHDREFHAFELIHDGRLWGQFRSPLHGRHNLQNVVAAVAVDALFGGSAESTAESLESFQGVRRRMDVFLKSDGILFIEDFAHHPTAIRETIAAAKQRYAGERVTVLFEPRSNTTATNTFQSELVDAFQDADEVWIGPIYRADQYPEEKRLDRARLVGDLNERGVRAHFTDNVEEIVRHIRDDVSVHEIVLVLSNGKFEGIYDYIRAFFTGQTDG